MGRCFWGSALLLHQGLGQWFDQSNAVVSAPAVVIFVMTVFFPAVFVFVGYMVIFPLFAMVFSFRDFGQTSAVSVT